MAEPDPRAKKVIALSGNKIKANAHSKTPGIIYIAQGSTTEIRNNKSRN